VNKSVYFSGVLFLGTVLPCININAQVPINSNVALQPSRGGFIIREQIRLSRGNMDGSGRDDESEQAILKSTFVYGATEKLTLMFNVPVVLFRKVENHSSGKESSTSGFADFSILSKIRLYRDDFGINDTARLDLIAGLSLPVGKEEFSSDSVNPVIGSVFTLVQGKHSFSTDVLWQFNTGDSRQGADLLRLNYAYIYRLLPDQYDSNNPTAVFASLELNGTYETNGDRKLFLSPGIQYVTTRWIAEATVQIPVLQELEHQAEKDFIVGIGFRYQF